GPSAVTQGQGGDVVGLRKSSGETPYHGDHPANDLSGGTLVGVFQEFAQTAIREHAFLSIHGLSDPVGIKKQPVTLPEHDISGDKTSGFRHSECHAAGARKRLNVLGPA